MNMGEQETLITVALPEATRANSAVGGLDNNVLENYDLRFILEIYQGEYCYRMESIGQETEATFPVRVVQGHEYDFVVWADFVAKGAVELAENDIFYNTNGDKGLQNITILNNAAMTEARDAYYGVAHLDADKAVSTISNITLTRPFAKVRVITTDLSDCIEKLGLQPSTATVTYTTETYDKFDARNKNVWSVNSNDNVKSINYDPSTRVYSEDNLFVDYILVPQGTQSTVKFDLNVTDVINRSFNTDIAVEANKLTTIKGNILTNGSDIKVEVKDDFVSETIYLEGDVTLTEDLVIDRPMVVRDDATAVLNLNGHKIINTTGTADYESEGIIVYGNLTINDETGEGLIEANSRAIWARGNYGATITINGGNYVGAHLNTEVIYASGNGQIEINDGTFEAKKVSTGHGSANNRQHIILNLHNNGKDGCNIVVKGGSYKNFDPANNIAENPVKNFCAEGYVSVANGEWFDVIYDSYYGYTKVSDVAGLKAALTDNTVEKIYLAAGEYDLNDQIYYLTSKKELVSDAAIKPVVKGKFVADYADLTATNIKFGRNSQSNLNLNSKNYGTYVVDNYSAIITLNYAAGTFEACEFDGEDEVVAINYFQDAAGKVLNVNNCTFTNTFIYSKVLCNITNNTFNLGNIPYGICVWPRPAGSTNSICYVVNNTLNSTYFPTENLAYCQVQLLSQSTPYANLEFNIQGNFGAKYTVGWANSVKFKNDGSITFADGSKTFNLPNLVD